MLEYEIWNNLYLFSWARAIPVWLQGKPSLIPFEVRVVFLSRSSAGLPQSLHQFTQGPVKQVRL